AGDRVIRGLDIDTIACEGVDHHPAERAAAAAGGEDDAVDAWPASARAADQDDWRSGIPRLRRRVDEDRVAKRRIRRRGRDRLLTTTDAEVDGVGPAVGVRVQDRLA